MQKGLTALFICIFALFSCSEEQDFGQFDDLSVTPTLASSILYLESGEDIINLAGSGNFYSEVFTFEAFNEAFVSERILDGTITYQVENTTSKEIAISIDFLDDGGNVLDTEAFVIQPDPAPFLVREIAYGNGGRSLDILRNTTEIRVGGQNLGDDTSTSTQPNPKIILKSSAAFRLRLQ
ncbi:hypothetical protein [Allomuricauda sp. d1]|uniref:hypothetical protein n=1 Tax=Allomuricauda sp. d1 TaxID=3136725 RepID=UPI0031DA0A9F